MRLYRDRIPEHASISGSDWPEHASISGRLAQACVYIGFGCRDASISGRPEACVYPGIGARACVYPGAGFDPGMRLFRVGWPKHASIPGSVSLRLGIMRLSRSRLTRACVYPGVGWPRNPVRLSRDRSGPLPSMRLSRDRSTRACVYPGPVDPGMRLSRGRLPKHASIPGVGTRRLSRGRLTRACVYFGVGWPKHASIPGSVGLSMRLLTGVYRGGPSMRLSRDRLGR